MEANNEKTGLYGTVKLLFAHKKQGILTWCKYALLVCCYKKLCVNISVSGVLLNEFAAWFYVITHQH